MASPAQLVETVSRATGVPLPTMVDIDRKLVKGNLRTKGGRGLNAALMTPLDAARLLTAVLGNPQANESASTVRRYADTRVDQVRSSGRLYAGVDLDDLALLVAGHSFVDGLASLIKSASTGSLAKLFTEPSENGAPHIEVFAFTRATRGRIQITGLPNRLTASVEYATADGAHARLGAAGDLEQSRRITELTICSIAELLSLEDSHDQR